MSEAKLIIIAAALLKECQYAVAFLEDLEASANSCTDPENPQAASFHMTLAGLRHAIKQAVGK